MGCVDCISETSNVQEFCDRLFPAGINPNPLPLSGSVELTLRCNVRCKHCYILYPGATDNELSTEDFKTVLKKLADGGVLFLLMTGGEIFARPDFRELYLYAKELGFVLSLYTNATLVDESIIDFLVKYPPRRIEVTIYGHTEKVYEAITGVMGSFVRFRRGVDLMLAAGLSVRLKTMVLKTNLCEFDAMRDWSLEKTGSFRYDANVGPKLDQDNAPLRERISPREYLSVEQRDSVNREQYHQVTELVANLESGKDLFMCGTGVLTIHVDPRGLLHPCMLWRKGGFNLLERDAEEWGAHLASLRSAKNPEGGCNSCSNRGSCGRCPASALLETGDPTKNIPYHCEVSEERKRVYRKEKFSIAITQDNPLQVN